MRTNIKLVLNGLLICSVLPLASYAQIAPALQPETPSVDTSPPAAVNPRAARGSRVLNGTVERSRYLEEQGNEQSGQALEGQLDSHSVNLKPEAGSLDNTGLRAEAENKIARRIPLNAAEFRSLDAGIIGYIAVQQFFARSARVIKLLPGCPAEQAGIRVGDLILKRTVDPSKVRSLRKPFWLFRCGQAGEPCELTIMRQGQIFKVNLAYMNIEDVADDKLRRRLESLVEQAGFQAYHSAEGANPSDMLDQQGDEAE